MAFDEATIDIVKEDLVLTKLSNSFELRQINEEYYVLIQGVIVPYRIFMVALLKYGLWEIRFSKTDWFLINRDLFELWDQFDVLPTGVEFDLEKRNNRVAPIRWLKKSIMTIEFDKKITEFFSVRCGDFDDHRAKYEALLYFAEEKYATLANK